MDYVSLKIPMGLKAQKHIKSKGKLFSKAELIWETACCNREPGSAPLKQGGDGASGQAAHQLLPLCFRWQSSFLRMVYVIDGSLTCVSGCDWENHCSGLPILKTWLHSSFATICTDCLHSLFLFLKASHAKPSGSGKHTFTEHSACAPWGRITNK